MTFRNTQYKYQINFHKKRFRYRYDPVPGIHKHKNGSYMRRMKTTQERRINCLHYSEGFHIRGKRKHKMLINAWEDVLINKQKNWKKFRKKQWK